MFFVVVLIIIAFGTIFGHSRFSWQQQVPRLMIFAIVINFSRTLCGIIIDFSQVVMLTFANALKDIAGGNFIQLFGLGDILSITTRLDLIDGLFEGTTTLQAFDWFAASGAAILMMAIVLAVVFILAAILVWRIVALWVLIVLSPLAWFVGGAKGIAKSSAYEEWWQHFTCAVAIGPILIFFLWLTLAVAGSGNIAVSDPGFLDQAAAEEIPSASQNLLKIFETHRLISFVIGIAMLMAGFQAGKTLCGSSSGFVSSALSKGEKFAKGALKSPYTVSRYGAKKGYRFGKWSAGQGWKAGKAAAGAAAPYVVPAVTGAAGSFVGGGLAKRLEQKGKTEEADKVRKAFDQSPTKGAAELLRQKAGSFEERGAFGRVVGGAIRRKANEFDASHAKDIEAAGEKWKTAGRGAKVDRLNQFIEHPEDLQGLTSTSARREALALTRDALGDKKAIASLEKAGTLGAVLEEFGDDMEQVFGSDALAELKASRPHLTGDIDKIQTLDDVKKLSSSALEHQEVRDHIDSLTIDKVRKGDENAEREEDREDRLYTAGEWIREGRMGGKKREAVERTEVPPVGYDTNDKKFGSNYARNAFRSDVQGDLTQLTRLSDGMLTEPGEVRSEARAAVSNKNLETLSQNYLSAIRTAQNAEASDAERQEAQALSQQLDQTFDQVQKLFPEKNGRTPRLAQKAARLKRTVEDAGYRINEDGLTGEERIAQIASAPEGVDPRHQPLINDRNRLTDQLERSRKRVERLQQQLERLRSRGNNVQASRVNEQIRMQERIQEPMEAQVEELDQQILAITNELNEEISTRPSGTPGATPT